MYCQLCLYTCPRCADLKTRHSNPLHHIFSILFLDYILATKKFHFFFKLLNHAHGGQVIGDRCFSHWCNFGFCKYFVLLVPHWTHRPHIHRGHFCPLSWQGPSITSDLAITRTTETHEVLQCWWCLTGLRWRLYLTPYCTYFFRLACQSRTRFPKTFSKSL